MTSADRARALGLLLTVLLLQAVDGWAVLVDDADTAWLIDRGSGQVPVPVTTHMAALTAAGLVQRRPPYYQLTAAGAAIARPALTTGAPA